MKTFQPRWVVRLLFWYAPLLAAGSIGIVFFIWGLRGIAASKSSTAAVGYVFLPLYAAGIAALSFGVVWSFLYLTRFTVERLGLCSAKLTKMGVAGSALIVLIAVGTFVSACIWRHNVLHAAKYDGVDQRRVASAVGRHDVAILANLAQNPNTSVSELRTIYDACKVDVGDKYPKDYNVLHALARNRKTPSDMLVVLGKCKPVSIRVAVATNPNTPEELLPDLASDKEDMVRTWVTANPNISEELLLRLTLDDDTIVRSYAESHLRQRRHSRQSVH